MPAADTTHRAALLPSDALGASSTSELQVTKGGTLVTLPFEGSNVNKQRPFLLKIWGRSTTAGGASNLTVKIYYGTSSTIGNNVNIASTGAVAAGSSVSSNFYLECLCIVDSTSQKINGLLRGWVGATAVAQAFATAVPTGVDPSVEGNAFSATIQFSASNAGIFAIVDGFEVEAR